MQQLHFNRIFFQTSGPRFKFTCYFNWQLMQPHCSSVYTPLLCIFCLDYHNNVSLLARSGCINMIKKCFNRWITDIISQWPVARVGEFFFVLSTSLLLSCLKVFTKVFCKYNVHMPMHFHYLNIIKEHLPAEGESFLCNYLHAGCSLLRRSSASSIPFDNI